MGLFEGAVICKNEFLGGGLLEEGLIGREGLIRRWGHLTICIVMFHYLLLIMK